NVFYRIPFHFLVFHFSPHSFAPHIQMANSNSSSGRKVTKKVTTTTTTRVMSSSSGSSDKKASSSGLTTKNFLGYTVAILALTAALSFNLVKEIVTDTGILLGPIQPFNTAGCEVIK